MNRVNSRSGDSTVNIILVIIHILRKIRITLSVAYNEGCAADFPTNHLLYLRPKDASQLSKEVVCDDGRGENILLFLVQTVGRQLVEQRQYRPSRVRSTGPTARKHVNTAELGQYFPTFHICLPAYCTMMIVFSVYCWMQKGPSHWV